MKNGAKNLTEGKVLFAFWYIFSVLLTAGSMIMHYHGAPDSEFMLAEALGFACIFGAVCECQFREFTGRRTLILGLLVVTAALCERSVFNMVHHTGSFGYLLGTILSASMALLVIGSDA